MERGSCRLPSKYNIQLRLISAFVILVFGLQDLTSAAPLVSGATPVQAPTSLNDVILDPARLLAPSELMTVSGVHKGTNDRLVIHIQDPHLNFSGQKNLAAGLDAMMTRYGIGAVLVEGADRDATLTDLKSEAPQDVWRQVAYKFLLQGKISGEEYLNLTSEHPMRILGIEDGPLYLQALKAYASIVRGREPALRYLHRIRAAVDRVKSRRYPRELVQLEASGEADAGAGTGADARVGRILPLAREAGVEFMDLKELVRAESLKTLEKSIDFDRAGQEQSALEAALLATPARPAAETLFARRPKPRAPPQAHYAFGSEVLALASEAGVDASQYPAWRAYFSYLGSASRLDPVRWMDEAAVLEERTYEALLKDQDLRTVRLIDRYLRLFASACELKLSSDEYARFRALNRRLATESWLSVINRHLAEAGYAEDFVPSEPTLDRIAPAVHRFYSLVRRRDQAFVRGTDRFFDDPKNSRTAFLVAGGYHTAHLTRLLRDKGYSYAVLTPAVSDETDRALYEKVLLADAPVDRRVSASTLRPAAVRTSGARLGELQSEALRLTGPARPASAVLTRPSMIGRVWAFMTGRRTTAGSRSFHPRYLTVQSRGDASALLDRRELLARSAAAASAAALAPSRSAAQDPAGPEATPSRSVGGAQDLRKEHLDHLKERVAAYSHPSFLRAAIPSLEGLRRRLGLKREDLGRLVESRLSQLTAAEAARGAEAEARSSEADRVAGASTADLDELELRDFAWRIGVPVAELAPDRRTRDELEAFVRARLETLVREGRIPEPVLKQYETLAKTVERRRARAAREREFATFLWRRGIQQWMTSVSAPEAVTPADKVGERILLPGGAWIPSGVVQRGRYRAFVRGYHDVRRVRRMPFFKLVPVTLEQNGRPAFQPVPIDESGLSPEALEALKSPDSEFMHVHPITGEITGRYFDMVLVSEKQEFLAGVTLDQEGMRYRSTIAQSRVGAEHPDLRKIIESEDYAIAYRYTVDDAELGRIRERDAQMKKIGTIPSGHEWFWVRPSEHAGHHEVYFADGHDLYRHAGGEAVLMRRDDAGGFLPRLARGPKLADGTYGEVLRRYAPTGYRVIRGSAWEVSSQESDIQILDAVEEYEQLLLLGGALTPDEDFEKRLRAHEDRMRQKGYLPDFVPVEYLRPVQTRLGPDAYVTWKDFVSNQIRRSAIEMQLEGRLAQGEADRARFFAKTLIWRTADGKNYALYKPPALQETEARAEETLLRSDARRLGTVKDRILSALSGARMSGEEEVLRPSRALNRRAFLGRSGAALGVMALGTSASGQQNADPSPAERLIEDARTLAAPSEGLPLDRVEAFRTSRQKLMERASVLDPDGSSGLRQRVIEAVRVEWERTLIQALDAVTQGPADRTTDLYGETADLERAIHAAIRNAGSTAELDELEKRIAGPLQEFPDLTKAAGQKRRELESEERSRKEADARAKEVHALSGPHRIPPDLKRQVLREAYAALETLRNADPTVDLARHPAYSASTPGRPERKYSDQWDASVVGWVIPLEEWQAVQTAFNERQKELRPGDDAESVWSRYEAMREFQREFLSRHLRVLRPEDVVGADAARQQAIGPAVKRVNEFLHPAREILAMLSYLMDDRFTGEYANLPKVDALPESLTGLLSESTRAAVAAHLSARANVQAAALWDAVNEEAARRAASITLPSSVPGSGLRSLPEEELSRERLRREAWLARIEHLRAQGLGTAAPAAAYRPEHLTGPEDTFVTAFEALQLTPDPGRGYEEGLSSEETRSRAEDGLRRDDGRDGFADAFDRWVDRNPDLISAYTVELDRVSRNIAPDPGLLRRLAASGDGRRILEDLDEHFDPGGDLSLDEVEAKVRRELALYSWRMQALLGLGMKTEGTDSAYVRMSVDDAGSMKRSPDGSEWMIGSERVLPGLGGLQTRLNAYLAETRSTRLMVNRISVLGSPLPSGSPETSVPVFGQNGQGGPEQIGVRPGVSMKNFLDHGLAGDGRWTSLADARIAENLAAVRDQAERGGYWKAEDARAAVAGQIVRMRSAVRSHQERIFQLSSLLQVLAQMKAQGVELETLRRTVPSLSQNTGYRAPGVTDRAPIGSSDALQARRVSTIARTAADAAKKSEASSSDARSALRTALRTASLRFNAFSRFDDGTPRYAPSAYAVVVDREGAYLRSVDTFRDVDPRLRARLEQAGTEGVALAGGERILLNRFAVVAVPDGADIPFDGQTFPEEAHAERLVPAADLPGGVGRYGLAGTVRKVYLSDPTAPDDYWNKAAVLSGAGRPGGIPESNPSKVAKALAGLPRIEGSTGQIVGAGVENTDGTQRYYLLEYGTSPVPGPRGDQLTLRAVRNPATHRRSAAGDFVMIGGRWFETAYPIHFGTRALIETRYEDRLDLPTAGRRVDSDDPMLREAEARERAAVTGGVEVPAPPTSDDARLNRVQPYSRTMTAPEAKAIYERKKRERLSAIEAELAGLGSSASDTERRAALFKEVDDIVKKHFFTTPEGTYRRIYGAAEAARALSDAQSDRRRFEAAVLAAQIARTRDRIPALRRAVSDLLDSIGDADPATRRRALDAILRADPGNAKAQELRTERLDDASSGARMADWTNPHGWRPELGRVRLGGAVDFESYRKSLGALEAFCNGFLTHFSKQDVAQMLTDPDARRPLTADDLTGDVRFVHHRDGTHKSVFRAIFRTREGSTRHMILPVVKSEIEGKTGEEHITPREIFYTNALSGKTQHTPRFLMDFEYGGKNFIIEEYIPGLTAFEIASDREDPVLTRSERELIVKALLRIVAQLRGNGIDRYQGDLVKPVMPKDIHKKNFIIRDLKGGGRRAVLVDMGARYYDAVEDILLAIIKHYGYFGEEAGLPDADNHFIYDAYFEVFGAEALEILGATLRELRVKRAAETERPRLARPRPAAARSKRELRIERLEPALTGSDIDRIIGELAQYLSDHRDHVSSGARMTDEERVEANLKMLQGPEFERVWEQARAELNGGEWERRIYLTVDAEGAIVAVGTGLGDPLQAPVGGGTVVVRGLDPVRGGSRKIFPNYSAEGAYRWLPPGGSFAGSVERVLDGTFGLFNDPTGSGNDPADPGLREKFIGLLGPDVTALTHPGIDPRIAEAIRLGRTLLVEWDVIAGTPVELEEVRGLADGVSRDISMALASEIGLPPTGGLARAHIETIISEMLRNGLVHGNRMDPRLPLALRLDVDPDRGRLRSIQVFDAASSRRLSESDAEAALDAELSGNGEFTGYAQVLGWTLSGGRTRSGGITVGRYVAAYGSGARMTGPSADQRPSQALRWANQLEIGVQNRRFEKIQGDLVQPQDEGKARLSGPPVPFWAASTQMSTLRPIQKLRRDLQVWLNPYKLEVEIAKMKLRQRYGLPIPPLAVLQIEGVDGLFVIDGHHRSVAALDVLGPTASIPVNIIHIQKPENFEFEMEDGRKVGVEPRFKGFVSPYRSGNSDVHKPAGERSSYSLDNRLYLQDGAYFAFNSVWADADPGIHGSVEKGVAHMEGSGPREFIEFTHQFLSKPHVRTSGSLQMILAGLAAKVPAPGPMGGRPKDVRGDEIRELKLKRDAYLKMRRKIGVARRGSIELPSGIRLVPAGSRMSDQERAIRRVEGRILRWREMKPGQVTHGMLDQELAQLSAVAARRLNSAAKPAWSRLEERVLAWGASDATSPGNFKRILDKMIGALEDLPRSADDQAAFLDNYLTSADVEKAAALRERLAAGAFERAVAKAIDKGKRGLQSFGHDPDLYNVVSAELETNSSVPLGVATPDSDLDLVVLTRVNDEGDVKSFITILEDELKAEKIPLRVEHSRSVQAPPRTGARLSGSLSGIPTVLAEGPTPADRELLSPLMLRAPKGARLVFQSTDRPRQFFTYGPELAARGTSTAADPAALSRPASDPFRAAAQFLRYRGGDISVPAAVEWDASGLWNVGTRRAESLAAVAGYVRMVADAEAEWNERGNRIRIAVRLPEGADAVLRAAGQGDLADRLAAMEKSYIEQTSLAGSVRLSLRPARADAAQQKNVLTYQALAAEDWDRIAAGEVPSLHVVPLILQGVSAVRFLGAAAPAASLPDDHLLVKLLNHDRRQPAERVSGSEVTDALQGNAGVDLLRKIALRYLQPVRIDDFVAFAARMATMVEVSA